MNKQINKQKKEHQFYFKWMPIIVFISILVLGLSKIFIQQSVATDHMEELKETIIFTEVFPGLDFKKTTKETRFYSSSITQPMTKDDAINKEINQWVDQEIISFVLNVEKRRNKTEDKDFHGHLKIETEANEIAENIYTLELVASGVSGKREIKPFVVDLNTNEILKIEDIFELELEEEIKDLLQENIHIAPKVKNYTSNYLSLAGKENVVTIQGTVELDEELQSDWETNKEIKELVLEEMKQNLEFGPYLFEDLSKRALANPENWRLSVGSEAVSFYFDQFEVARGDAGTIKADIPIEKIQKYLKIEIFEKLGMNIPQEKLMLEPAGKYIALTFDDGPHPTLTPRVLDTLKEYEAKATFFMGGYQAESSPEIVKEMKEAGHELGDHTLNHLQLSKLTDAQIRAEISESSRRIEEAGEARPTVMRPPYGDYDERVERITKEMDLPIIMWSVDTLDWKNRNPQAIINETMPAVTPGGIVLMHDIHETTADALPQILDSLKSEGYTFVTVSQLINLWDNEETHVYFGGDAREMSTLE